MARFGPDRLPKGPAVRIILETQLRWQLAHTVGAALQAGGRREECLAFLCAALPGAPPE